MVEAELLTSVDGRITPSAEAVLPLPDDGMSALRSFLLLRRGRAWGFLRSDEDDGVARGPLLVPSEGTEGPPARLQCPAIGAIQFPSTAARSRSRSLWRSASSTPAAGC